MPLTLTKLGEALERNRIAAGLTKKDLAPLMGTTSRALYDRVITTERPRVDAIRRAATAVRLDPDEAFKLAGYDPALIAETRQQPEQQQQGQLLAG